MTQLAATKLKPVNKVMPVRVTGGLAILGILIPMKKWPFIDREILLYDAHAAYRQKIKECHSDLGGSDAEARRVIEAFRLVKRYCQRVYKIEIPTNKPRKRKKKNTP